MRIGNLTQLCGVLLATSVCLVPTGCRISKQNKVECISDTRQQLDSIYAGTRSDEWWQEVEESMEIEEGPILRVWSDSAQQPIYRIRRMNRKISEKRLISKTDSGQRRLEYEKRNVLRQEVKKRSSDPAICFWWIPLLILVSLGGVSFLIRKRIG